MEILVLNEDEVRRLLDPRALLDALANGFRALTAGDVPQAEALDRMLAKKAASLVQAAKGLRR